MDPVTIIAGPVSALLRDDVDTDQIMPKQFLKRVERTGFGEFLFFDWAKQPGWDLPANPILVTGENFGCCTKIGLLPIVVDEQHCQALARAGEGQVDLQAQEVRYQDPTHPIGELIAVPFEIDPEIRRRLLAGLDDIGVTLDSEQLITAFEGERERSGPFTTAL